MKLKKRHLIALVKVTSLGKSTQRVSATIELIETFKDPVDFCKGLKETIKAEIGPDNESWQVIERPKIHIEYAEDEQQSFDLTIGTKKMPPLVSEFEANTVSELESFLSSHGVKTPISEIEISFAMKNTNDGKVVRYIGKNFSDDVKYKGTVKKARINELKEKGIAFYREFQDIF